MYLRLGGQAVGAMGGQHRLHYDKAVMAKVSGGTADRLVVKRVEQGATKNGAFKVTVTYSDYGTPVTAPAPDPADTVEPSEPAALDTGGAAG